MRYCGRSETPQYDHVLLKEHHVIDVGADGARLDCAETVVLHAVVHPVHARAYVTCASYGLAASDKPKAFITAINDCSVGLPWALNER